MPCHDVLHQEHRQPHGRRVLVAMKIDRGMPCHAALHQEHRQPHGYLAQGSMKIDQGLASRAVRNSSECRPPHGCLVPAGLLCRLELALALHELSA